MEKIDTVLDQAAQRKADEVIRHKGALDGFEISRADAEVMIMQARIEAGWVTEADLAPPEPVAAEADGAPAGAA